MKTEDGINKEDCDIPVPIMVIALAIVISVCLYIFTGFTQYESVSKLLEAHGSLIAGILGVIGVFILVWNQNKSTQKTVDATLRAIRLESLEIKKRNVINELITLVAMLREMESMRWWMGIDNSYFKIINLHLEKVELHGGTAGQDKLDCIRALIELLEKMSSLRNGSTYLCSYLPTLENRYNEDRLSLMGALEKIKVNMSEADRNTLNFLIENLDFEIKIHEGEPIMHEDPDTGEMHELCEVQEDYVKKIWTGTMPASVVILRSLIEFHNNLDVSEV